MDRLWFHFNFQNNSLNLSHLSHRDKRETEYQVDKENVAQDVGNDINTPSARHERSTKNQQRVFLPFIDLYPVSRR